MWWLHKSATPLFVARNYRSEYDNYHKASKQKKRRAGRNAARRLMMKAGRAKKGDGKDVHHVKRTKGKRMNNSRSNLRITSKSANRSNNS